MRRKNRGADWLPGFFLVFGMINHPTRWVSQEQQAAR